ncbi:MAG: hypothetical protein JST94_06935 [Bacteroidetes bacterium]|nr:hypothetical protein [Bacteroidota bacterium]MBS1671172.1 hypothetical protein [Bacteroidota bacterium]
MKPLLLILYSLAIYTTNAQLQFSRVEGLSQNTVYSITKDKQGFIWIATANGINRYDGKEMKIYKPSFTKSKKQIEGRIVRSTILVENDILFFSTENSINQFDKKSENFKQYKVYIGNHKEDPIEEKEGNTNLYSNADPLLYSNEHLWVAQADRIFNINTKTNKSISYTVPFKTKNNYAANLSLKGCVINNSFWFATQGSGIIQFDFVSHKWQQFLSNYSFSSITICNDTLYAHTANKVIWFNPANYTNGIISFNSLNTLRTIYTDYKKNIWLGDDVGNVFCKTFTEKFFYWKGNINYNYSQATTKYPVYCFYADTVGNLWVGADVLGLLKSKINNYPFKKYPDEYKQVNEKHNLFIHSIYVDNEKKIWLGTYQNGIIKLDRDTKKSEKLLFNIPISKTNNISASTSLIKEDDEGNIWTNYAEHLLIKEKESNNFTAIKLSQAQNSTQSPQVWCIEKYKTNWLVGTNIGAYIVKKFNGKYTAQRIENFGVSKIFIIKAFQKKQLWIVPEVGGIYIIDDIAEFEGSNTIKRIFENETVKAIEYDAIHNLYWISTANGLIAYHAITKKFKTYNEQQGMLNNFVYGSVLCDNEIWLSTNNGLSQGKIQFNNNNLFPEIVFTNYTVAEGLPSNEFNTNAFYKDKNGILYFGTDKGVVWFNPKEITHSNEKVNIQLLNVLANEKNTDSTLAAEYISNLSLLHNNNNLFFKFININFHNPDKIKYAYFLEGWDKDWINNGTIPEARYSNLEPGKYTFKIKATNNAGIWSTELKEINITIHPPFWQTNWFIFLVVIISVTTIILIAKFYVQQKLKIQIAELQKAQEIAAERQRISREMHDDIGSGLTQIALISDAAIRKNKLIELNDIAQTSRKLISNMSEIVWSLQAENKTLEQLFAYLREQLFKLLEYSGIDYEIQFPENTNHIIIENKQSRNILLITKEIVTNTVKHSKAKHITISSILKNKQLYFEIKDDGIGFTTSIITEGNGLKNIKSRINDMKGTLNINSTKEGGTIFNYTIPL